MFDVRFMTGPSGLVSFTRRSLEQFPNWEDSRSLMSAVHITHKGKIEDEGVGCLQVNELR